MRCVLFSLKKTFDTKVIDRITIYNIKTSLLPVLTRNDIFDLDNVKKIVKSYRYLPELMVLTKSEKEFLEYFERNEYRRELVFNDDEIIAHIKNHPMALWRVKQKVRQ